MPSDSPRTWEYGKPSETISHSHPSPLGGSQWAQNRLTCKIQKYLLGGLDFPIIEYLITLVAIILPVLMSCCCFWCVGRRPKKLAPLAYSVLLLMEVINYLNLKTAHGTSVLVWIWPQFGCCCVPSSLPRTTSCICCRSNHSLLSSALWGLGSWRECLTQVYAPFRRQGKGDCTQQQPSEI